MSADSTISFDHRHTNAQRVLNNNDTSGVIRMMIVDDAIT